MTIRTEKTSDDFPTLAEVYSNTVLPMERFCIAAPTAKPNPEWYPIRIGKILELESVVYAHKTLTSFLAYDGQPLTRTKFIRNLKFVVQCLGWDDSKFNGHRLRIGAATTCSKLRMEDHLIKTLGRWSSDCYTRYISTDQATIQEAQMAMSTFNPE